ncbi:MAG: hypothetical protein M3T55_09630 [Pseudomonadota bacterium]|nr:hypothetical protein [Pseudomonadota bacterium]
MLIIDFARPGGPPERVGVVGSCRVHDPLKEVARSGRGVFLWSAFNSFTHTPAEAAQHIAFCRGRLEIPEPFGPYILRQDKIPLLDDRLPNLVESCTTFMVEISGMEYLRCGHYTFNQDYFSQQFVRGGGLGVLDWHRHLSAAAASPEKVRLAMASLAGAGKRPGVAAEEILTSLRSLVLSAETYEAELGKVIFDTSKRWIFVPHFNVSADPAQRIVKRAVLRDLLERDARALGCDFYDPTPIVARHGREAALEGGGVDTYHYAPAFMAIAGEGLYEAIMQEPRPIALENEPHG